MFCPLFYVATKVEPATESKSGNKENKEKGLKRSRRIREINRMGKMMRYRNRKKMTVSSIQ